MSPWASARRSCLCMCARQRQPVLCAGGWLCPGQRARARATQRVAHLARSRRRRGALRHQGMMEDIRRTPVCAEWARICQEHTFDRTAFGSQASPAHSLLESLATDARASPLSRHPSSSPSKYMLPQACRPLSASPPTSLGASLPTTWIPSLGPFPHAPRSDREQDGTRPPRDGCPISPRAPIESRGYHPTRHRASSTVPHRPRPSPA